MTRMNLPEFDKITFLQDLESAHKELTLLILKQNLSGVIKWVGYVNPYTPTQTPVEN